MGSVWSVERKEKGPINFQAMVPQSTLTHELVLALCREYKIMSEDIFCRCDANIDQLMDVVEGNRTHVPCICVLNKIDQLTIEELDIIDQLPHHVPISAGGAPRVHLGIYKMIRIYVKPKGCIPDYGAPVVLHDSAPSIEDFCFKLHKQLM
eukprot:gene40631-50267_t